MNWPTAFTYFWMVATWVLGIAIAIKHGVMWAVLAVVLPPAAWIFLAQWVLERAAT